VLFFVSFVVLVLAIVLDKFRPVFIAILLALAGWTNLTVHTAVISPNDRHSLIGNKTKIATVRGILIQTPQLKISQRDGEPTEHSRAQIQVAEIRCNDNCQLALGQIVITTPSTLQDNFFAGQSVEITGVISRPSLPLAEGLFDHRDYLKTRGIYYELKTESTNDWHLRAPILSKPPLTDRFLYWSKRTLAFGLPTEDEPLRLLWAMTLGCSPIIRRSRVCRRSCFRPSNSVHQTGDCGLLSHVVPSRRFSGSVQRQCFPHEANHPTRVFSRLLVASCGIPCLTLGRYMLYEKRQTKSDSRSICLKLFGQD
jgi:hypothetical protein